MSPIKPAVKRFIQENSNAIRKKDWFELFVNIYYDEELNSSDITTIIEMINSIDAKLNLYEEQERFMIYVIGRGIEQCVDENESFPMDARTFIKTYIHNNMGFSLPAIVELIEENGAEWDIRLDYADDGTPFIDSIWEDMETV